MFNQRKNVDSIDKYFIDSETHKPLTQENTKLDFGTLCRPNMHWVFNKCMKKSEKFRQMLEKNSKAKFLVSEYTIAIEKDAEIAKRQQVNYSIGDDMTHYSDPRIIAPILQSCSLQYYNLCRTFFENKANEGKIDFNID